PNKCVWNSGRLGMGSQTGSIFKRAMDADWPATLARRRNWLIRVLAHQQHSTQVVSPARPSMSLGSSRVHCRSSLFPVSNRLHERFEARIVAKIVEEWISRKKEQVAFVASRKAVLERFDGAFFFA